MNFYDFHIHSAFSEGTSSLEQLASMAKDLGFTGICFAEYYKNEDQIKKLQEEIRKVKEKVGIEIFLGFEAKSIKELSVLKSKRRKFDVLLVRGGDSRLNREAVETAEVDILTHPEYERQDCGLNQVMMKLAKKNDVAIEINFREVLISNKKIRAKILSNIQRNVLLAKKYRVPLITCSGAISHFELRDPQVMVSFATLLGLELKEAKETVTEIPENILKRAKERKSEDWIAPGIKVVR